MHIDRSPPPVPSRISDGYGNRADEVAKGLPMCTALWADAQPGGGEDRARCGRGRRSALMVFRKRR